MLRILSKIRIEIFEQSKPKHQQFIIILKSDSHDHVLKHLCIKINGRSECLCPGVPVHRGNNYCTPLFTTLC